MCNPVSQSKVNFSTDQVEKHENLAFPEKKINAPLLQRIAIAYKQAVFRVVEFFRRHRCIVTAAVIGEVFLELPQALKIGFFSVLGWKKHFNFYDLNPKSITSDQAELRPILLIHGNLHNQSVWLEFAKMLKTAKLGPVYTVNLPSGLPGDKDVEILNKKYAEIKEQYKIQGKKIPKVNLVGYSKGGCISECILKGRPDIFDKIITVGYTRQFINDNNQLESRIFEITGKFDALISKKSSLPSNQQLEVDTGHLGLVFSEKVHQQIIDWLSQN